MKLRSSVFVATLCFTLSLSTVAPAQNYTRARQAAEAARDSVVSNTPADPPAPNTSRVSQPATPTRAAMLEGIVPRNGLQFYFEIRGGGFAQVMQSAPALAPLVKSFAGQAKLSLQDFTAFALAQAGTLARARVALVGYGGTNAAALFEVASGADAESLKASLTNMLASNHLADVSVSLVGEVVVAGAKSTVEKCAGSTDRFPLAEDRMFMKMRDRFAADPFFAYMELDSQLALMPDGESASYLAGFMTGLQSRPYALACGGSLERDMVRLKALALFTSGKTEGLFSDIFSSENKAGLVGASFAAPDADLFLDVTLNWNKVYDSMQSLFGMAAGAMMGANAQPADAAPGSDLFQMAESRLGFSIKNDLLPTLGSEFAISFADFDRLVKPTPQPVADDTSARPQIKMPRILLMVELRDPAKFEKLFYRLLSPPNRTPVELSEETYRGVTIKSGPMTAFAITRGFFLFAPSVAEIRRALDGRASGRSLASSADFRSAVGSSDRPAMQAYVSSGMASILLKSILAQAMKSNEALRGLAQSSTQGRSAIGLTMKPEAEGLMLEMRVPANLAFMAIASMATSKPAPYGISTSGERRNGGRRTPKMTDEDARILRKK